MQKVGVGGSTGVTVIYNITCNASSNYSQVIESVLNEPVYKNRPVNNIWLTILNINDSVSIKDIQS